MTERVDLSGGDVIVEDHTFLEYVDLSNRQFNRVHFLRCTFRDGVNLSNSRCAGDVEFICCEVWSGYAHERHSEKSINLARAQISGRLNIRGTILLAKGSTDENPVFGDLHAPDICVDGGIVASSWMAKREKEVLKHEILQRLVPRTAEVIMPRMGDGMEEGTLLRWLKKDGEKVKSGEVIGTIQYASATLELKAPGSGTLTGSRLKDGEATMGGLPIAAILKDGNDIPNWDLLPIPFVAQAVELSDCKIHGRVDFGGARLHSSFRLCRGNIQGSLTLEWRAHSFKDFELWKELSLNMCEMTKQLFSLRTEIGGRLDLDKVSISGSIMARGIRVRKEALLTQASVGGSVIFRAWHIVEREESSIDHFRWLQAEPDEAKRNNLQEALSHCPAIPTELHMGVNAASISVRNVLSLTGCVCGQNYEAGVWVVDLFASQLGGLKVATWRDRSYIAWPDAVGLPADESGAEVSQFHRRATIHGDVRLIDTEVKTSISMNGAEIRGSLYSSGLKVGGTFDLSAFVAVRRNENEPNKSNIDILPCSIGLESGEEVPAFRGRQMQIGGTLMMDGCDIYRGIWIDRLEAAEFKAEPRGHGARFEPPRIGLTKQLDNRQWSLRMEFANLDGRVTIRGAKIKSAVSLYCAKIRGGLQAGPFRGHDGKDLFRTTIGKGSIRVTHQTDDATNRAVDFGVYLAHAEFGGDVCLDCPCVEGSIQGEGVNIRGSLQIRKITDPKLESLDTKIDVDSLSLYQDPGADSSGIILRQGALKLTSAEIGEEVNLTDISLFSRMSPRPQIAIDFKDATIERLRMVCSKRKRSMCDTTANAEGAIAGLVLLALVPPVLSSLGVLWFHDFRALVLGGATTIFSGILRSRTRDLCINKVEAREVLAAAFKSMSAQVILLQLLSWTAIGTACAVLAVALFFIPILLAPIIDARRRKAEFRRAERGGSSYGPLRSNLVPRKRKEWIALAVAAMAAFVPLTICLLAANAFTKPQLTTYISTGAFIVVMSVCAVVLSLVPQRSPVFSPQNDSIEVTGTRFDDLDLGEESYWPRQTCGQDVWRSSHFERWVVCAWCIFMLFVIPPWLVVMHWLAFVAALSTLWVAVAGVFAMKPEPLRDFLSATKFDAGFYCKVERWLQGKGRAADAGRVSRSLQRRRMAKSWLSVTTEFLPHSIFGHGTRLWPTLLLYVVSAFVGFQIFSQQNAVVETKLVGLVDGRQVAYLQKNVYPAQNTKGEPVKKNYQEELTEDKQTIQNGVAPTMRALLPFAIFNLGEDFTYSNDRVSFAIPKDSSLPTLAYTFAAPGYYHFHPEPGSKESGPRGITYAEVAAIFTLLGWLLIPIFLIKLVAQMRRLEARDFEA